VAGLVVITPAAGFVSANGAVLMGVLGALVPYFVVTKLKAKFGFDDSLDAFGIHGVGGTLGAILTGVFASVDTNTDIAGLVDGLLVEQLKSVTLNIVLAVVGTTIIAFAVRALLGGLRPEAEVERRGLDIEERGEEGYIPVVHSPQTTLITPNASAAAA
jgi:Amt family ammonium transporter